MSRFSVGTRAAAQALKRSDFLIQLHSVETEWKYVRVSVLFLERRVEVLVELVELIFVAVQPVE